MRAHDPAHAKGIDVSSWQGSVDWPAVQAAGYSFAVLKASEGVGYLDPTYATSMARAKGAGLMVGAYHFARPSPGATDAQDEAAYFLRAIGMAQPAPDFVALDLEATQLDRAGTTAWARAWLEAVSRALPGKRVVIYTGPAFITAHLDAAQLAGWPLWIAHYTQAPTPAAVPGWSDWTFWQWTSSGRVAGVSGNVDLDEFAGTEADLRAWIAGGSVPAQQPSGGTTVATTIDLPLLTQGAQGPAVAVLQRMLADRGYYQGAIDGDFGPKTSGAVRTFQTAYKLVVDGKAGPQTWSALTQTAAADPQAAALRQQVAALQSKIQAALKALA